MNYALRAVTPFFATLAIGCGADRVDVDEVGGDPALTDSVGAPSANPLFLTPADVQLRCGSPETAGNGAPVTDVHLDVNGWPEPVFLVQAGGCEVLAAETRADLGIPTDAAFAIASSRAGPGTMYYGTIDGNEITVFEAEFPAGQPDEEAFVPTFSLLGELRFYSDRVERRP